MMIRCRRSTSTTRSMILLEATLRICWFTEENDYIYIYEIIILEHPFEELHSCPKIITTVAVLEVSLEWVLQTDAQLVFIDLVAQNWSSRWYITESDRLLQHRPTHSESPIATTAAPRISRSTTEIVTTPSMAYRYLFLLNYFPQSIENIDETVVSDSFVQFQDLIGSHQTQDQKPPPPAKWRLKSRNAETRGIARNQILQVY